MYTEARAIKSSIIQFVCVHWQIDCALMSLWEYLAQCECVEPSHMIYSITVRDKQFIRGDFGGFANTCWSNFIDWNPFVKSKLRTAPHLPSSTLLLFTVSVSVANTYRRGNLTPPVCVYVTVCTLFPSSGRHRAALLALRMWRERLLLLLLPDASALPSPPHQTLSLSHWKPVRREWRSWGEIEPLTPTVTRPAANTESSHRSFLPSPRDTARHSFSPAVIPVYAIQRGTGLSLSSYSGYCEHRACPVVNRCNM